MPVGRRILDGVEGAGVGVVFKSVYDAAGAHLLDVSCER
jgi:hypothetical protein